MSQASVSRAKAVKALKDADGDLVNAVSLILFSTELFLSLFLDNVSYNVMAEKLQARNDTQIMLCIVAVFAGIIV